MRLARQPKEPLESFINRVSIYRHENDRSQNHRVGVGHLLDAAKLTMKDEDLIKTLAGGLHDELTVVNAMLNSQTSLRDRPDVPSGGASAGSLVGTSCL